FSGELLFADNDPDAGLYNFVIHGNVTPVGPAIAVRDEFMGEVANGAYSVDLGTTVVDVAVTRTLTIENPGTETLVLDTASLTVPDGYSLIGAFPSSIAPSSAATFQVALNACELGTYEGDLSFANS